MKMSFDEKLTTFFSKIEIKCSAKPADHLTHLYADYVEIVSLFSNSNFISTSDILDRFKDEGIIRRRKNDSEQAQHNDDNERWVDEIFQIIQERKILYAEEYPFEITNDNKLRLKPVELITAKNKVYLFLLISACLYQFSIFEPELTSEFELLCFHALLKFLPAEAIVKSFGKNSEYTGTAIDKIRALASELNLSVDEAFLNKISKKGVQERGLDLIGWLPFQDKVGNLLVLLSQCACGKEWYKKLTESRRYEKYYKFYCNKPVHLMFIPYSLINYQDLDFYQADELSVDTLLFERKRILNYIHDSAFFNSFDSKKIVEKCILYEEDIV